VLFPLPDGLREQVDRARNPVRPRDSATVAVVRDGAEGIEAFLMRRQASMAFAAGMDVFPGGAVHDADHAPLDWIGPSAEVFAGRLGCSAELAHALVVAAVRETFEETGVLLAGPDGAATVDAAAAEVISAREELEAHRITFADFLRERRWAVRADLLGVWAHWITPAFEPRRYDTRFFVAALPDGQRVGAVSAEASGARWRPLSRVLRGLESGEARMLAPTAVTCRELAAHSAATILDAAAERTVRPIEPRLVEQDGELFLQAEGKEWL